MKKNNLLVTLLQCAAFVILYYFCQKVASFMGQYAVSLRVWMEGLSGEEAEIAFVNGYNRMIYEMLALASVIFFGLVTLIYRKNLKTQLRMKKMQVSEGFAGVFLGLGAYFVATLVLPYILALIPAVQESSDAYAENHNAITSANPLFLIEFSYSCILAPLVEETLFRGIIQNKLRQHLSPLIAILATAVGFGLFHGNSYQISFSLPLGILLGYVAFKSDSLWPSVLLHAAFNGSNYLLETGRLFGFEAGSDAYALLSLAGLSFCGLALPMGILFWKMGAEKRCAPALMERKTTPEPDFSARVEVKIPQTDSNSFYHTTGEQASMAAPEFLIVGLGNPGEKYAANRHNCGFMAMDYIALRLGVEMKNLRFRSLCAEAVIDGKKVLLLKPQTFMNLSGEAVREAAAFYKIPPQNILVIFDDINFEPGVFRIRPSGSAGGHNGIKSIISCLSSDAFPRVKMGVGAVPPGWDLMNHVLGNPSKEDLDKIISSMEDIYSTARAFVGGTLERAASLYSGKRHGQ